MNAQREPVALFGGAARFAGAALGLLCAGCPAGSSLDTAPQEYVQPVSATIGGPTTTGAGVTGAGTTGVGGSTGTPTTGAVATTGAPAGCSDAEVQTIFVNNCSTAACHGNVGAPPTGTGTSLHLFDPAIRTSFVGRPGVACANEFLIDPNNPSASLLVTVLRQVAQCGVAMPSTFFKLPDPDIACIESWVNGVVTGQ